MRCESWEFQFFGHLLRTMCVLSLSRVLFFAAPLTVARQTPLPRDSQKTETSCRLLLRASSPQRGQTHDSCMTGFFSAKPRGKPAEDCSSSSAPRDCPTWDRLLPRGKGRGQRVCDFDEEVRAANSEEQKSQLATLVLF